MLYYIRKMKYTHTNTSLVAPILQAMLVILKGMSSICVSI